MLYLIFPFTVITLPEDQSSLNAGLHFLCQMLHISLWGDKGNVIDQQMAW